MSRDAITFRTLPDLRKSSRRAVGFLKGHRELNASDAFDGLGEDRRRYLQSSMDEWISGKDVPATRFHGWPNDAECSMCFVFKARERRQNLRFYGYLCNPLPKTNPRFQLCVLCIHAVKKERESDRSELLRVGDWSRNAAAKVAVGKEFPDEPEPRYKARGEKWKT